MFVLDLLGNLAPISDHLHQGPYRRYNCLLRRVATSVGQTSLNEVVSADYCRSLLGKYELAIL